MASKLGLVCLETEMSIITEIVLPYQDDLMSYPKLLCRHVIVTL